MLTGESGKYVLYIYVCNVRVHVCVRVYVHACGKMYIDKKRQDRHMQSRLS